MKPESRIVLDTNVLVSGLLNPHGPPGRIVDLVTAGALRLLIDDRILAEYRQVLLRPRFGFSPDDVSALLDLIAEHGEPIVAPPQSRDLPDPADLPFLEVALAASADSLVTGNLRHFPADPCGVRIEEPARFLDRWREQSEGGM